MDDMAQTLSALLDSPEGMEKIKSMAGMLLGGDNAAAKLPPLSKQEPAPINDITSALSGKDIETIMKIVSRLKAADTDSGGADLLRALKPHLSAARQDKVDKAIKLMKLGSILPLLREEGFMQIF